MRGTGAALFVRATNRKISRGAIEFLPGMKSGPFVKDSFITVTMRLVKEKFCAVWAAEGSLTFLKKLAPVFAAAWLPSGSPFSRHLALLFWFVWELFSRHLLRAKEWSQTRRQWP